jgi:hypothetical protein
LSSFVWRQYRSFDKECKPLIKKYPGFLTHLEKGCRLIESHFSHESVISSNKILHVTNDPNGQWALWKLKLYVKGLKSGQWPRVWFGLTSNYYVLLAIRMHQDNYDDNHMNKLAVERLQEVLIYEENNPALR